MIHRLFPLALISHSKESCSSLIIDLKSQAPLKYTEEAKQLSC